MTQPLIRILQIEESELSLKIITTLREDAVLDDLSDVSSGSPLAGQALIWDGSVWRPQPVGGAGVGGSSILQNPSLSFQPGHLVVFDNIPGGSPPGGSPGGFYNVDVIRLGTSNQFIVSGETATNFGSPRYSGSPQVIIAGSPANQTSLEIRANTPGLMFYDNDATGNEKSWRFVVDEGDFIGELRSDSGKLQNRWLELTRTGVRVDDLYLYVGQQERAIHAVRGGAVELYHNNVLVAETSTAGDGFRVNRGPILGFERVLTESDQVVVTTTNVGDGLETFGSPITIRVDATVVRFSGSPIVTGSPNRGDILYDDGSGRFVRLPIGTTGQVLTAGSPTLSWKNPTATGGGSPADQLNVVGGDGITATYGSPDVTIAVDATVLRTSSSINDFNDVVIGSPQTVGDTLYFNGTNWVNLGVGTAGQVLTVGSPGPLVWTTPSAGGSPVDPANIVGGDGITVTVGSPEYTVAVDGTVFRTTNVLNDISDVIAGSPTIGTILYNDGTNWLKLPRGTAGQFLRMGSPLLPTWQTYSATGGGSPVDPANIVGGDGITVTVGSPEYLIAVDGTVLRTTSSLNDLGDVVAGSPTIGAILYNDGTNWLKLPRGTNNQVLTMGSPLLPVWKAAQGGAGGGSVTAGDALYFTGSPNVILNVGAGDGLQIIGSPKSIAVDSTVVRLTPPSFGSPGIYNNGSLVLAPTTGDAVLHLRADPTNTVETDNPYIFFEQDGGAVPVIMGPTGTVAEDPQGNTLANAPDNSFVIHSNWTAASGQGGLAFGVDGQASLLVSRTNSLIFRSSVNTRTESYSANILETVFGGSTQRWDISGLTTSMRLEDVPLEYYFATGTDDLLVWRINENGANAFEWRYDGAGTGATGNSLRLAWAGGNSNILDIRGDGRMEFGGSPAYALIPGSPSAQGMLVRNLVTGTGLERVLTTSDLGGVGGGGGGSPLLDVRGGDGITVTAGSPKLTIAVDSTVARMSTGSPVLPNTGSLRIIGSPQDKTLDIYNNRVNWDATTYLELGSGDQYFADTVLFLAGSSSTGSPNPIVDSSFANQTVTTTGSAFYSATQSKYATASIEFTGSPQGYLTVPDSTDFTFSNNDWTIECWAYTNVTSQRVIYAQANVGSYAPVRLEIGPTAKWNVLLSTNGASWTGGTSDIGGAVSTGTWVHLAVVRDGTLVRLYEDGVQSGTRTISTSSLWDSTEPVGIGINGSALTAPWDGFIEDLRVTKGVCRYPDGTSFTPPSTSLPTGATTFLIGDAGQVNQIDGTSTTIGDGSTTYVSIPGGSPGSGGMYVRNTVTGTGLERVLTTSDLEGSPIAFALNDLTDVNAGSPTIGTILYNDGTNWLKLPRGTSGQFLRMGSPLLPTWQTYSAGGGGASVVAGDALYYTGSPNIILNVGVSGDGLQIIGSPKSLRIDTTIPRKQNNETITGNWTFQGGSPIESQYGTGAKVEDGTGVARPVGFNVAPIYEINTSLTFDLAHNGFVYHKFGSPDTAITLTCSESGSPTTIPQGASWVVHNDSLTDITITAGAGVTINFLASGGAPVAGDVTVQAGGIVTVYKYTDTEYWVWGDSTALSLSLNDLSNVTEGSPTIGALLYNDGTTWLKLPRGTNGQVLTMGSPLLPVWAAATGGAGGGSPIPDLQTVTTKGNTTSNRIVITDVGGSPVLALQSGDSATATNGWRQISFGFNGTDDYRHWMGTRHDAASGANNAIEFYLWNQGTDNLQVLGTHNAFTIYDGGFVARGPTVDDTADFLLDGTSLTLTTGSTVFAINLDKNVVIDDAATTNEGQLALSGGANVSGAPTGSSQITFGYTDVPGDYRHSLRTRHNGGGAANNHIEFWLWNPDAPYSDSVSGIGTQQAGYFAADAGFVLLDNAGGTDSIAILHDGTNVEFNHTNTANWYINNLSGSVYIGSPGNRVLTTADSLNDLGDVVAGSPTIGAILYNDGTNWLKLPRGTNGQFLRMGSPLLPTWQTYSAGGGGGSVIAGDALYFSGSPAVLNVGAGNGLQIIGSPKSIAIDGTVVQLGSPSAGVSGDIIYHDGTNWSRLPQGTTGQRLGIGSAGTLQSDWTRQAPLTINNAQVSAGAGSPSITLTDFPVLITAETLPSDMLDSTGTSPAQADGGDIRFSTDAVGANEIPCEIVDFALTAGSPVTGSPVGSPVSFARAQIWVKVPSVSSTVDTTIYVWWSPTSTKTQPAVTAPTGRNAVWSDYSAVYHMEEDPSGTSPQIVDSTGNGNDGTSAGAMTSDDLVSSQAQLGNGIEFDGSNDYIDVGTGLNPDPSGNIGYTVQAWVRSTASASIRQILTRDGSDRVWQFRHNSTVDFIGFSGGAVVSATSATDVTTGDWFKVDGRFETGASQSTTRVFINGSEDGSTTGGNGTTDPSATDTAFIGARSPSDYYSGTLDEIRFRPTELNDDWLATEYNNQSDPNSFITVGASSTVAGSPGAAILWQDNELSDLTDVSITGGAGSPSQPLEGDVLYFDGTNWVNLGIGTSGQVLTVGSPLLPKWAAPTGGGSPITADLKGLTDVSITGGAGSPALPTTGDILYYDGTNWVNLARGTNNQVLTMGSPLLPVWKAAQGGSGGGSPITADLKGLTDTNITGSPQGALGDILYYDGTNWTNLARGTAGQSLRMGTGSPNTPTWTTPLDANGLGAFSRTVGATWANPGSTITVPVDDVYTHIPANATIVGITILGESASGSCKVDVYKDTLGNYPPTSVDSIVGSPLPGITSGRTYTDSTLTGWTTTLNEGDVLGFHLQETSTFEQIYVQLELQMFANIYGSPTTITISSLNQIGDVNAGSPTIGAILYNDGTNWLKLPRGTSGQVLTMGSPLLPSWAAPTGGGGGGSPVDPSVAIFGSPTVGSPTRGVIWYDAGDQKLTRLLPGTAGQVLTMGSPLLPSWQNPAAGGSPLQFTAGDGLAFGVGSPQSLNVDSTVARLAPGSPPSGSPSDQIWYTSNTFTNDTSFDINPTTVDGTGVKRPVGLGVFPPYEIDTSATFDTAHAGMVWHVDAGSPAVTFTAPNDSTIEIGSMWQVQNDDVENVTIAQGSPSVTILRLGAGGAPVAGNVLVQQGGIVTIYKYTDTEYWVYGDSEAIGFGSPVPYALGDLTDVTLTTSTAGDIIYYNGTNWVNLPLGSPSAGYVLTHGSPSPTLKWLPAVGGGSPTIVTVTGADTRIAVFGGPNTLQGDATFLWDDATATLSLFDTGDADSVTFQHDGTDFNTTFGGSGTTTDWNILGLTGAVNIEHDTTAAQLVVQPASTTGQDAEIEVRGARNGPSAGTQVAGILLSSYDDDITSNVDLARITSETVSVDTNLNEQKLSFYNRDASSLTEHMYLYNQAVYIPNSGGTDYVAMSHDGTDFNFDYTNTTDVNFTNITSAFRITNGTTNGRDIELEVRGARNDPTAGLQPSSILLSTYDSDIASTTSLARIASEVVVQDTSHNDMKLTFYYRDAGALIEGMYLYNGGLYIVDSTGADSMLLSHDGTDFNTSFTNTTDWNIGLPTGAIRFGNPTYAIISGSPQGMSVRNLVTGTGLERVLTTSDLVSANIVGGDGITVTTGSPEYTVAVDATVFRTTNVLNDISDVSAGSPTIGAILYNDGTNWLKLPRGTNGQVLTMGSPLLPKWAAAASGGSTGSPNTYAEMFVGSPVTQSNEGTFSIAGSPVTQTKFNISVSGDDVHLFRDGQNDGEIIIGDGSTNNSERLRISNTGSLTLSGTSHPFQIGPSSSGNLRFSTSGLMAANAGAAATLSLQASGGDIYIGAAAAGTAQVIRWYPANLGGFRTYFDTSGDYVEAGAWQNTIGSGSPAVETALRFFGTNIRSFEMRIQATAGNNYHTTNIVAIHGGSPDEVAWTEHSTLTVPSFFGSPNVGSPARSGEVVTYDVRMASGQMVLYATPRVTGSITIRQDVRRME